MTLVPGLLDSKNTSLWNELFQFQNIKITYTREECYGVKLYTGEFEIFIPENDIKSDSFTHELLHIWLRKKSVIFTDLLLKQLSTHNTLRCFFEPNYIIDTLNGLEHVKIFPEFLTLGYDESQFLNDYSEIRITTQEILLIRQNYFQKKFFVKYYRIGWVADFIRKYFGVQTCPKAKSYEKLLIEFAKIDPKLFSYLDVFFRKWVSLDIDKATQSDYTDLVNDFISSMEEWAKGKRFIPND